MPPTLQELQERAKPFTAPISADKPTGTNARSQPAYEAVLGEVGKLEALTGGPVDWVKVADSAGTVLKTQSKDLMLACYLGASLHQTQGLTGLATGMVVISELLEQYWPTLFPELNRIRGRINALGWFIQRTTSALGSGGSADADSVEAVVLATARLSEIARAKFEAATPALTPLQQAVERLKADLPPPPPPPTAAAPVASTPAPAAAAAPGLPSAGGVNAEGATAFLREVGSALVTVSGNLRREKPEEPLGYRLSRAGLWLHVTAVPPAGPNGRTSVPPLPANTRAQLDRLAGNGKWAELIEESEGALTQFRFCLDLHAHTAKALAGLGHGKAREAVIAELAALLRRLPGLADAVSGDGTPFADAATKRWLTEEVLPSGGGNGVAGGDAKEGSDAWAEVITQAQTLIKEGNAAQALPLVQAKIAATGSARDKFRLRLALANLCVSAGQVPVARGLYAALEKESTDRGLDDWEPSLVAQCLEGLITTSRMLGKGNALTVDVANQYHRLCQLDPAVALRLGL